jgi:hypothetical protein
VLAANPKIAAEFGDSSHFLAQGGFHVAQGSSAPESYSHTVTVAVNLADLASPGLLEFGLYGGGGNALAPGVDAELDLSGNNFHYSTGTLSYTDAIAEFTDQSLAVSLSGLTGTLDLTIGLTVNTDQAGASFSGDFIIGERALSAGSIVHAWATQLSPDGVWHHSG